MSFKKILFISHDGMTDPLGQSQVIPYLSNLTKYGYSFTILSCDKPDRYTANKLYVEQLIKDFPITWTSIPYHKKFSVLAPIYDYYTLQKKAEKLHAIHQFDMVHTRPGLPSLVGIHLKKKFGLKFLNDIRGFWADERVDGGIWNLKNPVFRLVYKFFKRHEYDCLVHADYNITLTSNGRNDIHSRTNLPNQPVRIQVIPCSADLDLFNTGNIDASLREQFKTALNIKDGDFIISYLGSIGGWYLTDDMMRFCRAVADKIDNAKFLFISPDSHEIIAAAAAKVGLSNEKLIVKQGRRHEIPALLSFSAYSFFFIKPCHSKIASSPTKHGEIMAMGIPTIANSGVGDMEEIMTKYNAGYVVHDFSDAAYKQVIEKMLAGNNFDATAIRNGAKDFYSLQNAVQRYREVYDTIFNRLG